MKKIFLKRILGACAFLLFLTIIALLPIEQVILLSFLILLVTLIILFRYNNGK